MTLRVLTLNIWNNSGKWPERCARIREELQEIQPDIIAFQEVLAPEGSSATAEESGGTGGSGGQLREMLHGLGYEWRFAGAQPFWGKGAAAANTLFGNAVASRWPISNAHTIALPHSDTAPVLAGIPERRVALLCAVASPHGPLLVCSTHFNYRPDDARARERQAVALARAVRAAHASLEHSAAAPAGGAPPRFPPIVCGDFNAPPQSACVRFLTGLQSLEGATAHFYDAFARANPPGTPGFTWSHTNRHTRVWLEPDARLDYIFVGEPDWRGRGHVARCAVACAGARRGHRCSDHFGVVADLATAPMEAKYARVRRAVLGTGLTAVGGGAKSKL